MATAESKCYDVAVIGAGPAGCSAARALANKGFRVVLIEKAALPRYKTCGGGVLARAYRLLPKSANKIVEREFHSVSLNFAGLGSGFVATRTTPLVYMTMRADLDCLLARDAEAHGAELVERCCVKKVKECDQFVEVTGDTRSFRAKFLVAADGVYSPVAKLAGWSELPQMATGLEWELSLPEGDFARFGARARFDFNSEAGYAWVFPKREHLSVGILSVRRHHPGLQAKLAEYLSWLGIVEIQKMERHGFLIPIVPRREPLARGRILLAGDAAGLVDPVMAEGISHAVISGQLAARALADANLDVSQVSKSYDSLLRGSILSELRSARFLANFLYNCPRFRNWVFRRRGEQLTNFMAGVVSGERTYRGALMTLASYWKLFGFGRPMEAKTRPLT
jgi:geranylgeranyl reductase family protein